MFLYYSNYFKNTNAKYFFNQYSLKIYFYNYNKSLVPVGNEFNGECKRRMIASGGKNFNSDGGVMTNRIVCIVFMINYEIYF